MVKFERLTIPKSEDDVRMITEKIMEEEQSASQQEHRSADSLDLIANQLSQLHELVLYVVQILREVRDSVDSLAIAIRRVGRAMVLAQLLREAVNPEMKKRIVELLAKELGLEDVKMLYSI